MPDQLEKYDKDGPFMDPVVRCASCNALILKEAVKKHGSCPNCNSKRVKTVETIDSEKELPRLVELGVDPDFLKLFEPVDPEVAAGVIKND